MKEQLQSLLELLNQGLVQRHAVIRPVLLAALAGENPVLVGPPGTGKSLIARRIAQCFPNEDAEQGSYFEYLLTKFSTPEEIFGPLSISELKQDRFKRNTAGYLPSVRVAFLDEIFKASSSILNALLTILNERVYHNGAQVQRVPLQALIAASNELPTDHEELSALYDRFLLRVFVDYVGAEQLPALFATTTEPDIPAQLRLTQKQLTAIRSAADEVRIPDDIVQAVQQIWAEHQTAFKEDMRERLSDRRLKKLIHLMRVSAATNGRDAVDLSDVLLLKDSLWNHPDNREKVMELLTKVLGRFNQVIPLPAGEAAPSTTQAAAPAPMLRNQGTGQMNAVVKGYKGRGTEDDPLLIESVADFMDLARPEVGQQGYHFQQTQEIVISDMAGWPSIKFIGTYDGGGFALAGDSKFTGELLSSVSSGTIKKLIYKAGNLCDKVNDSVFYDCEIAAISTLDGVHFESCEVNEIYLKKGKVKIQNCIVKTLTPIYNEFQGDVNIVESYVRFIGGASHGVFGILLCDVIIDLADGEFSTEKSKLNRVLYCDAECIMIKCGTYSSTSIFSSMFTRKEIPDIQRTQRYFEHTLGFDFENVWRWDEASKLPALRYVGVGASRSSKSQPVQALDAGSVDLLSRQIQANIWL